MRQRGRASRRWPDGAPSRVVAGAIAAAVSVVSVGLRAPSARAQAGAPAAAPPRHSPVRYEAAAGRGQPRLLVEVLPDGVWAVACPSACSAREGVRIPIPAAFGGRGVQASTLELGAMRRVLHLSLPAFDSEPAYQVLVAAVPGGVAPTDVRVVYAGVVGAAPQATGEETRDIMQVRARGGISRVLVGQERADLRLCGRPAILSPRLLVAEDLSLHPAKVQSLPLEERRAAPVLTLAPVDVEVAHNALSARGASSAVGSPGALTDGRADTSWAEARGRDGRGEFVVFGADPALSVAAVDFLVRSEQTEVPDGVAPRILWLVTRDRVFRLHFPRDAWQSPGQWWRATLPEPTRSDCYAMVLEKGYGGGEAVAVTLSEVRGVSQLQSLSPPELVAQLSTPGGGGEAAAAALRLLGDAGAVAVMGAFDALNALGRARSLDVLGAADCQRVAGVYAALLASGSESERKRAFERLASCGGSIDEPLEKVFHDAAANGSVDMLLTIAKLSPGLSVRLALPRLVALASSEYAAYRSVLQEAASSEAARAALREALGRAETTQRARIELLRALQRQLRDFAPESTRAFDDARVGASSFEHRYWLLGPAAELAASHPPARRFLLESLRDADPYLRQSAARVVPPLPSLVPPLIEATRDDAVRVREAATERLAALGGGGAASVFVERLAVDPWPIVRVAAARGLAGLPASAAVDDRLAEALGRDDAERVRVVAAAALGRRGARVHTALLEGRLRDARESDFVRAAAARSLGLLCADHAVEALTAAASVLAEARVAEGPLRVGRAALAALGRLAPPDLTSRLAPLSREEMPPALRRAVAEALHHPSPCRGSGPG